MLKGLLDRRTLNLEGIWIDALCIDHGYEVDGSMDIIYKDARLPLLTLDVRKAIGGGKSRHFREFVMMPKALIRVIGIHPRTTCTLYLKSLLGYFQPIGAPEPGILVSII